MKTKKNNQPDKHPITNIDPIKGVTPEQLHDQCKYLLTTIAASFGFTDEQKTQVINNTVLYVYQNMEKGKVNKFDYDSFKGYLYISLKRQVLAVFESSKTKRTKFNETFLDISDIDPDNYEIPSFENEIDKKIKLEKIYEAVALMSELDKNIINSFLAGKLPFQIIKENKINYFRYFQAFEKLEAYFKSGKIGDLNQENIKNEINQRLTSKDNKKFADLTRPEKIELIKRLYENGYTQKRISQELGVGRGVVNHIFVKQKGNKEQSVERQKYLSQTEILRTYKISIRKLKPLLQEQKVPYISKDVNLGLYTVNAHYYLKEDIDKLGLKIKQA